MNLGRTYLVAVQDLRHNARRPLFWIFLFVLGLMAYGLSTGNVRIISGESEVGGTKAWLTSEFNVTMMFTFLSLLLYGFFVSVAAGMSVLHDDDLKVGAVLHATPLKPSEYYFGKFAAVMITFVAILALHVLLMMFFGHVAPNENADEIRGPFALMHYVRPALVFCLPVIVFFAGMAFAVGAWFKKPILIFVFPLAVLLVCAFFLWDWSPSWLDPRINQLLMTIEPAGFRWLQETWLKVDRGVDFYNTAAVGYDSLLLFNRLALLVVGLGMPIVGFIRYASRLRGEKLPRKVLRDGIEGALAKADARAEEESDRAATAAATAAAVQGSAPSLGNLRMRSGAPGFFKGALTVMRAEIKELRSQPGLYLFTPIIVLQVLGQAFFNQGPFDAPLLHTSGTLAAASFGVVTTFVCLLLLFYTVETMERERRSGFASIFHSTPISTGALLFGKVGANAFIVAVILFVSFLGSMIALAIQGQVPLDPMPFLLLYGAFLMPTFILFATFIMAVQALTRNRYTTYGIGLGALIFTGWRQSENAMNWVGNWPMWGAMNWSDIATFELNGQAMLLNRILALGLAVLFVAFTVRVFTRADRDVSRVGARLAPGALLMSTLRLSPYMIVPLVVGIMLYMNLQAGFQGDTAEKKQKDYWRRNMATWRDTKNPGLAGVDIDLQLDPEKRWLKSSGTFMLVNEYENETFRQIALTRGFHWDSTQWWMNGLAMKPDDRVGLVVFTPDTPMAPGDSLRISWSFEGYYPKGPTKNGGGAGTFVLPSSVVLTGFEPSFAPVIGYQDGLGVDEDNQFDAKEWEDDFYEGITEGAFGASSGLKSRIAIHGPADYVYNSVGVKTRDEIVDGRRHVVWETDHPVRLFNVVAGKWNLHEGEGTQIYYHAEHAYNIEEMSEALDGARKYFSEWFYPYPWEELKVSEFAALAGYAQGFPTNITFSEAIGFLTKSNEKTKLAFMVTSHEAAHQWWGNILLPGTGPGGNILSEGMAHFSTILLFGQVKGEEARMEFCKRIEEQYGDERQVDSERPLVKIDGSRPGDTTVQYDKGGWVFWMLLNHMGRERALEGNRAFINQYAHSVDHAVLQDYVRVMRDYAEDKDAYDDFVKQWFFSVVVPEYKVHDVTVAEAVDDQGSKVWDVSFQVENIGSSTMPLELAVTRGERFPDPDEDSQPVPGEVAAADAVVASADGRTAIVEDDEGDESDEYLEARKTIVIGKEQTIDTTIRCTFEPKLVVVDPDVKVLQLNRDQAQAEVK